MNKSNDDIDAMIKEALNADEAKFYDSLDEQNLPEMWFSLYRGKMKWITIYATTMTFLLAAAWIYCMYEFFMAEEIKYMIRWGGAAVFFMLMVSMLKVFHWMQMDKNSIIREIKRLELQISMMNKKKEHS